MKYFFDIINKYFEYSGLYELTNKHNIIQTQLLAETKMQQPKYNDDLRLNKFESQAH
jgi:hypothetical protein